MAGTIIVDTINSSVASTPPVFQANGTEVGTLCRAWVNFNGTGTVAIRASFNVSSITDNGTGDYTVNFTNAMPDANYSIASSMGEGASGGNSLLQLYTPVAGSFRFTTRSSSANGFQDTVNCCVAVFR
jgi:hypothetical protein